MLWIIIRQMTQSSVNLRISTAPRVSYIRYIDTNEVAPTPGKILGATFPQNYHESRDSYYNMNDRVIDILHRKATSLNSPYSYYVTRNRNTANWDIKQGVEILNEENYLNITESHLGLKNSIAACVYALETMGTAILA